MIRGIIADLDGFLVKTWDTEPLPGVLDTLAELRRRGIQVAVASNQAGPLWRAATGQEKYPSAQEVASRLLVAASRLGLTDALWYISTWDDRVVPIFFNQAVRSDVAAASSDDPMVQMDDPPTAEETAQSLGRSLTGALGLLPNRISASPGWRKPERGMLLAVCAEWSIPTSEAVYGGDMDSDKEAATAAGMRFVQTLPDVLALLRVEEGENNVTG